MYCKCCGGELNPQQSFCLHCGVRSGDGNQFCSNCGSTVNPNAAVCLQCGVLLHTHQGIATSESERMQALRKLSDYEKTSGIIWLIIGIVQLCTVVGVLCGVWNIFAAISRLNMSKALLRDQTQFDTDIYTKYERQLPSIIIILVLNIFFGAVIGIVGSIFDLFVRNYVMENKALFAYR